MLALAAQLSSFAGQVGGVAGVGAAGAGEGEGEGAGTAGVGRGTAGEARGNRWQEDSGLVELGVCKGNEPGTTDNIVYSNPAIIAGTKE